MGKKVLITGAGGFLGSFLVKRLRNQGYNVFTFSKHEGQNNFNVDVRDKERVFEAIQIIQPQIIFHLAALTNQSLSLAELFEVNVQGTKNVLDALESVEYEKFILFSAGLVYGANEVPFNENMKCVPFDNYSETKIFAERICLSKRNSVVLRFPIVYGPGTRGTRFFANLKESIRNNTTFVLKSKKSITRDFLYIDDCLDAVDLVLKSNLCNGVINFGTGVEISLGEVIDMVKGKVPTLKVEYLDLDCERVQRYSFDSSKAKLLFGWSPKVSLIEGVSKILVDVNKS